MNLLTIQQECGRLLGDPNGDRWPAATITTRANIIQTEIQGITDAVKTKEPLTSTVGVAAMLLNAATMDIVRVNKLLSDRVTIRPLDGITREELDFMYPDWQQWTQGEPLFWFWDATNLQINLVPAPSSQYAFSAAIQVWESRKPQDLVNSTDIPFDSTTSMIPYHMAIVHGIVAQCFQDDGTPEALAKSKFHRSDSMVRPGKFEEWIGKIMAEFDAATSVPSRVLYQPQGGRMGSTSFPTKAFPLAGF